jgi:endothelin-converting enzyme
MSLKTRARISMASLVGFPSSLPAGPIMTLLVTRLDGGWLKSNLLPSNMPWYNQFHKLDIENTRLVQNILQSNYSISPSRAHIHFTDVDYDALILQKLRTVYHSCIDERHLQQLGQDPLLHLVRKVRRFYSEKSTAIEHSDGEEDITRLRGTGLTAAVAFLHSRGM